MQKEGENVNAEMYLSTAAMDPTARDVCNIATRSTLDRLCYKTRRMIIDSDLTAKRVSVRG